MSFRVNVSHATHSGRSLTPNCSIKPTPDLHAQIDRRCVVASHKIREPACCSTDAIPCRPIHGFSNCRSTDGLAPPLDPRSGEGNQARAPPGPHTHQGCNPGHRTILCCQCRQRATQVRCSRCNPLRATDCRASRVLMFRGEQSSHFAVTDPSQALSHNYSSPRGHARKLKGHGRLEKQYSWRVRWMKLIPRPCANGISQKLA